MPLIDIDITSPVLDGQFKLWFRECTPKILVVTDNLNYAPANDFGLTEFVATLRGTTIHSMTPIVITARFNPNPMAALSYDAAAQHIDNFKFTDGTHGVTRSRYDVVFILSINGASGPGLANEAGALATVTAFMQAGGGVFATGDHDDLGAGMCMHIPRVRNMRNWTNTPPQKVPSFGGWDRLTTNLPGSNDEYEFADQSDKLPQRLYVNYRSNAGGFGVAHPLLQIPSSVRAVEVFPDHPHEGECIVPTDLTTKLPDGTTDEWPAASGGRVAPEIVAVTMSHGDAFPGKDAVMPRSFIAICGYDGHVTNVGRVVTDATWHHFVNINIKPGMSALAGRDLSDIKQYYVNLATWLMPKNVRHCRRFPWILSEMLRFPLFEELRPVPREELDGPMLRAIGLTVEMAMLKRWTRADVEALFDDALEEAIGTEAIIQLRKHGQDAGASPRGTLGWRPSARSYWRSPNAPTSSRTKPASTAKRPSRMSRDRPRAPVPSSSQPLAQDCGQAERHGRDHLPLMGCFGTKVPCWGAFVPDERRVGAERARTHTCLLGWSYQKASSSRSRTSRRQCSAILRIRSSGRGLS